MTCSSRVTTTTIFHWLPILRFLGLMVKFQISSFKPPKGTWPERYIMTLCARGVSKDAICGPGEKKTKKLSCVKLAIFAVHPRRCRPMKFCLLGRVRLYILSFMKIGWGVSELGGGSKIALSNWLGPWLTQQLVLPYKPWLKPPVRQDISSVMSKNEHKNIISLY